MRHTRTVSAASDGAGLIVHDGARTTHQKDNVMEPFLGQISIIGFNTPAVTRHLEQDSFELTKCRIDIRG